MTDIHTHKHTHIIISIALGLQESKPENRKEEERLMIPYGFVTMVKRFAVQEQRVRIVNAGIDKNVNRYVEVGMSREKMGTG